jgi:hypothetical protein
MSDPATANTKTSDDAEIIKNLDLLMSLDLFEDPELPEMVEQLEDLENASEEEGDK